MEAGAPRFEHSIGIAAGAVARKHLPSAARLYTYEARSLGPGAGLLTAWLFVGFQPLGVGGAIIGVVTILVVKFRPDRLADLDRVYVEDESISPQDAAAQFPVA